MRIVIRLLACMLVWPPIAAAAPQWERLPAGQGETEFVAVRVNPSAPAQVWAATARTVYDSPDGGRRWRARFRAPGHARIEALAVEPSDPPVLLAATDGGLYGSFDGGARWSRVFRGAGEGESRCTHVAFHPARPGTALLGTRGGLFLSADRGRHWTEAAIPQRAREVIHFAFDSQDADRLYLLATAGLFAGSLAGGNWQEQLGVVGAEDAEVEEPASVEAIETDEENGSRHRLSAIAVHPQDPATLYVAGSRGLARSLDRGRTWRWLGRSGPGPAALSRLLLQVHSPLVIYAASPRGVARYEPALERWTMLTRGWAAGEVHDLAAADGWLWAATDHGLYRYELAPDALGLGEGEPPTAQELLANFSHEPTMAQVREAAIRYAEVQPDKIRRWRRRAALQALLPTVDIGLDHDRSRDTKIDEGTFPRFQLIETDDRGTGLDLSVKWDLGELIWNQDQTAIDVRSKLMVQLRDDVVDEITRIYFERRRIQLALLTNPPSDQQVILEQELRIQELTALIDGLTGGYFTKQVQVNGNREEDADGRAGH